MSFINTRLNDRYLYGFTGGPQWNTLTTELRSGRQHRKKMRSMPRYRFATNFAALNPQEQESMLAAFNVCAGAFASFRFKDWNDFRALNQIIGVGDGTSAPLQLVRNYTFGAVTFTRPITLPINPVITDSDGNTITATVNATTGVATPAGTWPSGKVLRWSGEFDVRAHFSEDYNPLTAVGGGVRECRVEIEETLD